MSRRFVGSVGRIAGAVWQPQSLQGTVGSLYEGVLAGLCAPSTSQVSVAKHAPWRPVWRFFAAGKDTSVPDSPQPGLREFLDIIPEDGADKIPTGRAWLASELRLKSFDDLHRLWFVCLKEKNRLLARRAAYRSARMGMPDAERLKKVRVTMARIKLVLTERAMEYEDPQLRMAAKRVINAI